MSDLTVELLVLGAGPCGIGSVTRIEALRASGVKDPSYLLIDARRSPGGLASSVTTDEGFVFDLGSHILFPHPQYSDFARLLRAIEIDWHLSVPKRGVWAHGNVVPYPVQRNIQRLPWAEAVRCFTGLVKARVAEVLCRTPCGLQADPSLGSYLRRRFGTGITQAILGPLNEKMWACGIDRLESSWAGYRSGSHVPNVAGVSLWKLVRNMIFHIDDPGWSAQTLVPSPRYGGTGALWNRVAEWIPRRNLILGRKVLEIDSEQHIVRLDDDTRIRYRAIISSIPLDNLLRTIKGRPDLNGLADSLVWSSARLVGLGIEGSIPGKLDGCHSFQVPDPRVPFWRVSFPAALSPGNVPGPGYWSILCESSEPISSLRSRPNATE